MNSALPFDKHQWWPLNLTVLLNGPRGHWLAVVGKDADSHPRKDITCPTRALQELETTLFSWTSLHSSRKTYTMPVSWSKKYKPRYFPHTQSQLPPGRQSLRTVSHERRQELSPCIHLWAPEHFRVFYNLGWPLQNLAWNKGTERLPQCRPIWAHRREQWSLDFSLDNHPFSPRQTPQWQSHASHWTIQRGHEGRRRQQAGKDCE